MFTQTEAYLTISLEAGIPPFESIWLLQSELKENICRNGPIGTENLKFRFLLEPQQI